MLAKDGCELYVTPKDDAEVLNEAMAWNNHELMTSCWSAAALSQNLAVCLFVAQQVSNF